MVIAHSSSDLRRRQTSNQKLLERSKMENSNKPSSSSVQDVAKSPKMMSPKKMSPKMMSSMKMSPMKAAKMEKSTKQVALAKKSTTLGKGKGEVFKKSLAKKTKKSPSNLKGEKAPAKKQAGILKKSTTNSKEGMKTRASSNRASLDSLMAGFQSEGRAKTALGMPLKDFSESAVALLMFNYKVQMSYTLSNVQ